VPEALGAHGQRDDASRDHRKSEPVVNEKSAMEHGGIPVPVPAGHRRLEPSHDGRANMKFVTGSDGGRRREVNLPTLPSPHIIRTQDTTRALVAAAPAGGMIAAMVPVSADEAVALFGDVLQRFREPQRRSGLAPRSYGLLSAPTHVRATLVLVTKNRARVERAFSSKVLQHWRQDHYAHCGSYRR
jgi:hypothetical protein